MIGTDYTRTAGSLTRDDIVNDDQSFARLLIEEVILNDRTITFRAFNYRTGKHTTRCWNLDDKVTVSGRVDRTLEV